MLFIIFGLFFSGVTVLAVKRRAYEDNPYVFAMLVVFAVGLTLSGVSMAFIGSDRLSGFLLGGTMGTVICLLGGINIRAALVCDTPVEAARPENVILKRRIGVKNILFVLFGLFCYGFGLMVLFQ